VEEDSLGGGQVDWFLQFWPIFTFMLAAAGGLFWALIRVIKWFLLQLLETVQESIVKLEISLTKLTDKVADLVDELGQQQVALAELQGEHKARTKSGESCATNRGK
jgi:hypothetical protein